jgi:hypothetical protein
MTDKDAFMRRYALNARATLATVEVDINRYKNNQQDIQAEDQMHHVNFIRIDCSLLKQSLIAHCQAWQNKFITLLHNNSSTELKALHELFEKNTAELGTWFKCFCDVFLFSFALLLRWCMCALRSFVFSALCARKSRDQYANLHTAA